MPGRRARSAKTGRYRAEARTCLGRLGRVVDDSAVRIGEGGRFIEFGPRALSESDDPYAGDSFVARLVADGVDASRAVFMFRHEWKTLVGFFEDLASAWEGLEGERSYQSIERDLAITVTQDVLGHNRFVFVLRDGPTASWSARLESVEISSGEDTAELARKLASWAHTDARLS